MSLNEMQDERDRTNDASGEPKFYAVTGGQFEFYPTPGDSYTANLVYVQKIPDLATNSTNWLLTDFPDVYLYGSLTHSAPYLADEQRVKIWAGLYETALRRMNIAGSQGKFGSNLRMRRSMYTYN